MKTLQTIQTLSKIGRIVSKIVFICSVVGVCICIVGVVSLAFGAPTFKLGGVTLDSFLFDKAGASTGTLCAYVAGAALVCIGESILAKFAEHYFTRELSDGTPFTSGGASELLRLGVLTVCIPIGTRVAAQIVFTIISKILTDVEPMQNEPNVSVAFGLLLIVTALICRCGAELLANQEKEFEQKEQ